MSATKTKRTARITDLENAEMRAIIAEGFGGYQDLKPADIPKPTASDGRVLVRMSAAGVTPLDHTILSFPETFRWHARLSCWVTRGPALSGRAETISFRRGPA